MAALVAAIHAHPRKAAGRVAEKLAISNDYSQCLIFFDRSAWMAGSSPAMTAKDRQRGRKETDQQPTL
jgi:hypothetical protein